jgi:hypothetical protein
MDGLRSLKATERRKKIRQFIRQGLKEVEIAERLGVDETTISEDVAIIREENTTHLLSNKNFLDKEIENVLKALQNLSDLEEESWKIYYKQVEIRDSNNGNIIGYKDVDSGTKLAVIEKIRQINQDRAKLLKLLNPTQINIEKMVYVEKMVPVLVNKIVNVVLDYVPKERQVELLERLKVIDIDKEVTDGESK